MTTIRAQWGSTRTYWHEIEVDDDATEDEIEEAIYDEGYDGENDECEVIEDSLVDWEVME